MFFRIENIFFFIHLIFCSYYNILLSSKSYEKQLTTFPSDDQEKFFLKLERASTFKKNHASQNSLSSCTKSSCKIKSSDNYDAKLHDSR